MTTYVVEAPDGKKITLEGPEGASQEEVLAQAQALYKPDAKPDFASTEQSATSGQPELGALPVEQAQPQEILPDAEGNPDPLGNMLPDENGNLEPIGQDIVTPVEQPFDLKGAAVGAIEPTLIGGGATVGGVVGAAGAGPLGFLAGSTLGAAAGQSFSDFIREQIGDKEPSSILDASIRAAETGKTELMFTGGLSAAGPFARLMGAKIAAVTSPAAIELARAAERTGIPLGIVDVSEGFVKGSRAVLGKFPFVATPFKKSDIAKQTAVKSRIDGFLNDVAPNVTLTNLGVDMVTSARNTFREMKSVYKAAYKKADNLAAALPLEQSRIVPTGNVAEGVTGVRATAENLIAGGKIALANGKSLDLTAVSPSIRKLITKVSQLPDRMTVQEMRALQRKISSKFKPTLSNTDMAALTGLKASTEKAMLNMDVKSLAKSGLENEARAIKGAYDDANKMFAETQQFFSTPTAKKFTRVDKRIFKSGRFEAGTLNEDELARMVVNTKSPQAIRDLRKIVGNENVGKASALFVKNGLTGAISDAGEQGIVFSMKKFTDAVGLSGTRVEKQALRELLKDSPVTAKQLEDFAKVASKVGPITLPSQFVARRATLGGASAVTRALMPGVALAGGFASGSPAVTSAAGVALVLILRKAGRAITDPKNLKALTTLLDKTTPEREKKVLAGRILQQLVKEEEQAKTNPDFQGQL